LALITKRSLINPLLELKDLPQVFRPWDGSPIIHGFDAVFITCSLLLAVYLPINLGLGFHDSVGFLVHPSPEGI
jgi:hypothetical protein